MRRATATTAGRFYSLLSTPPPSYRHSLSLSSPRFHFYSPNSAADSSPPSSCYAIATNYSTLAHTPSIAPLWSLPTEADFISRIKLFLNGSSPDVLASEKPSMADLMKFLLSYVSAPLVSPLVYSMVYAERYNPQSTQFPKQHRGRMKGISAYEGDPICFGSYALQALEPAWITSNQIEAG